MAQAAGSHPGLDINQEPESTYMEEFTDKVARAIKRHKAKLIIPDQQATQQPMGECDQPPWD